MNFDDYKDFGFTSAKQGHMHARFMPHVLALSGPLSSNVRVLDVGCGNGSTCGEFLKRGCKVVGTDLSREGIAIARNAHRKGRFELLPADDNLLANLQEEPFDLVVSTEVVEHLYAPRKYARGCFGALKPGGRFICTTPYHGYLKNFALSRRKMGFPRQSAVGWWTYQALEPAHTWPAVNGNGIHKPAVSWCRTFALSLDDDAHVSRQT